MQAAEECFRRAVAQEPSHPMYQNNLGCTLAEQKESTSAVTHFQAAVALAPGFASAYSNLAETWFNRARCHPATTVSSSVNNNVLNE